MKIVMAQRSDPDCLLMEFNRQEVIRQIPVFTILGCIILFGCLGNAVSMYIYSRNFKDSNSRCFFLFLSGVELFSSAVSLPIEIYNLAIHFHFTNESLCKGFIFTEVCQVEISFCMLILIALDRWRKVCHPFGWQISVKMSKVLCVMLIPFGCLVASPSIAIYGSHEFDIDISSIESSYCQSAVIGASNMSTSISHSTTASSHVYETAISSTNIPLTNVSNSVLGHKCSLSDEASEGILPTLYSGLFWCLAFAGTGTLTIMYYNITKTIKLQDLKREQSTRQIEPQTGKKYKPKYRPQESIDMDCETDLVHSTYINGQSHVSAQEPSNINSAGNADQSKQLLNGSGYISQSKEEPRSNTFKVADDIKPFSSSDQRIKTTKPHDKNVKLSESANENETLPRSKKIPKIKIVEVGPSASSTDTSNDMSSSKSVIPDCILLTPVMTKKHSSNSLVSVQIGNTIGDNRENVYTSSKTEQMFAISNNVMSNENLPSGEIKVFSADFEDGSCTQNRHLKFPEHIFPNVLPPIDESDKTNTESAGRVYEPGNIAESAERVSKPIHVVKPAGRISEPETTSESAGRASEPINIGVSAGRISEPGTTSESAGRVTVTEPSGRVTVTETVGEVSRRVNVPIKKNKVGVLTRQSTRRQARSRNVTVIMLAVTISTVVGCLPYLILSLLRSVITDFEINLNASSRVAYNLFIRSIYFKSVANPIIYGLFDSRYRQILLKMFKGRCR